MKTFQNFRYVMSKSWKNLGTLLLKYGAPMPGPFNPTIEELECGVKW